MDSKVVSMSDAIARYVHDGDTVVIEGFTHLICFAAGHEIIRQGRRDLTLCRLTPDLIYDQMLAAGCARKLVFSWAGNPGAGSLHAFRRAVRGKGRSARDRGVLAFRDGGAVLRRVRRASLLADAGLPGTDIPAVNPRIRTVTCPYTGEQLATVPALNPDVTIVPCATRRPERQRPDLGAPRRPEGSRVCFPRRHRGGGRAGRGVGHPARIPTGP